MVVNPALRLAASAASLAAALTALGACGRGERDDTATLWPSDSQRLAEQLAKSPACAGVPTAPERWERRTMHAPRGTIALPAAFRTSDTSKNVQTWWAPDSSIFHYWAASEPVGSVEGQGGLVGRLRRPRYVAEPVCRAAMSRTSALVASFRHIDSAGTDTVFGFSATIPVRGNLHAGAIAFSPTAAMRDSLLGALQSMRW